MNFLRWLRCFFTHGVVDRLVPIQHIGSATVYRRISICPKCDTKLLNLIDRLGAPQ